MDEPRTEELVDEWGSDLDKAEWLVWFARKSKGKARDVAQQALHQHPGLRAASRPADGDGLTRTVADFDGERLYDGGGAVIETAWSGGTTDQTKVLAEALRQGPGRYSNRGSVELADRILVFLAACGYALQPAHPAVQDGLREALERLQRQVQQLPLWSPHPDIKDRVGAGRLVKEADVLNLIDAALADKGSPEGASDE